MLLSVGVFCSCPSAGIAIVTSRNIRNSRFIFLPSTAFIAFRLLCPELASSIDQPGENAPVPHSGPSLEGLRWPLPPLSLSKVALLLNENSCSPAPKSTFVSAGRETPVETTRQEDKFDSRSLSCLAAPPKPRATAGCGECRFVAN